MVKNLDALGAIPSLSWTVTSSDTKANLVVNDISKTQEIIVYMGRIANVILLDQWDDVIYTNVCISLLINTRNKK